MRRVVCLLFVASLIVPALGCRKRSPAIPASPPSPARAADRPDPMFPAPTIEISASPSSMEIGQQTTLSWRSSNASAVLIDGGIGNVAESGSVVVSPRESITYTAVASGRGGDARASTRVTVIPGSPADRVDVTDLEAVERLIQDGTIQPVFFEFDRSELSERARGTLEVNARHFKQYPQVKIVVEGHCDERGTEEYNLALGDRRALAAKDYLVRLGVDPNQLETISYGEERPFALGSNEEAWALNRRAHFTVRRW